MTAYLVQYGKPGFVGRFRPAAADVLARGDRVVVRSRRGLELGTLLCEPAARFDAADDGELVGRAADGEAAGSGDQEILAAAQARAAELGLPLAFVDVELLLDGSAILHGLPWAACDATALFEELAGRFGFPVRLLDLSRGPVAHDAPEPSRGCGKPDCGSGSGGCSSCGTGGGCSTGSCSRGSAKTADALTAYFRDLRAKMEQHTAGRTPLA